MAGKNEKPNEKPNKKPKEKPKKKPRKKSIPRRIFRFLVGAAIILAILFAVSDLKTITVDDNILYSQSEIADVIINDDYSWNTFYVYLKYLFREPQSLPFVESLDIRLTGLHSLNVQVNSKDLAGYIYAESLNRNVYFDSDGNVNEISTKIVQGVPKITGIVCEDAVQGAQLDINASTRKQLLNLLQTLNRKELIPDEIRFGETDSPILVLGNIRISLGDTIQMNQKIERAAAIYPQIQDKSGVLHLEDWNDSSSSIIFTQDTGTGAVSSETGSEAAADGSSDENSTSENAAAENDGSAADTADQTTGTAEENAADGTGDGTTDGDQTGEAAAEANSDGRQ